ncbi:MAG: TlpA disulfide reductase family protein [Planctomycetales bacterium]
MHPIDLRRPHWLAGVSPFLVMAAGAAGLAGSTFPSSSSVAAEPAAPRSASFAEILTSGTRRTFQDVSAHLEREPAGADAEEAHRWFLATAREYGWEADALSAAERYLVGENGSADTRRLAGEIRVLAPARAGRMAAAVERFEEHLASVRLRSADAAIRLGVDLASQAQLAGDFAAARAVFEKLPRPFFLNPQVEEFCNTRLAKLELAEKKAPEISVQDLSGEVVKADDYAGKVLLVDFWATDCAPCLEELPRLKRLHAQHGRAGFEILGISLDEKGEAVEEFRKRRELPWRMALSSSDKDATRTRYRARTIPSLFLIDRAGRVAFADLRGRELEAAVERLVGDESRR